MSKAIRIKDSSGPKGKCDICNTRPAIHWFGDTSVALCGTESCSRINLARWNRMIEEMEDENKDW